MTDQDEEDGQWDARVNGRKQGHDRGWTLGPQPERIRTEGADAFLRRLKNWRKRVEAHNAVALLAGQLPQRVIGINDPARGAILAAILARLNRPAELLD